MLLKRNSNFPEQPICAQCLFENNLPQQWEKKLSPNNFRKLQMCLKTKMIRIGLKDSSHLTKFLISLKFSSHYEAQPFRYCHLFHAQVKSFLNILGWVLFSKIWVSHYLPCTIPVRTLNSTH